MEPVLPGVWKWTLGEPEESTPVKLRRRAPAKDALEQLPVASGCPLPEGAITGRRTRRGFKVMIPLGEDEQIYGFGLQLLSFSQRSLKKTLRVNSNPSVDLGDSHAPVPFYVSTKGYGVYVDTARYPTFYVGSAKKHNTSQAQSQGEQSNVIVEIPAVAGIEVYVFAGNGMREAVQRYILFSGGGCLPARWGLGVWYRCHQDFSEQEVLQIAEDIRRSQIPCDVIGLEPGWQTHSYSCSYVWSDKFPEPKRFVDELAKHHYHVNLWTHAFIHPSSPLYKPMLPYAGDCTVWGGLVPDFTLPEARAIYAAYHEKEHARLGVSGYKLDECDNSDFLSPPWSFPEICEFPSGLDGEQMHCLMGIYYQETIESIFRERNTRTYGLVRSSHALAAPYPFVLYTDLYDHRQYVRGLVNAGFSGLLWCPEVRTATSSEDLIRRLQTVVFSPQAQIDAWNIKNPPWRQWDIEQNNASDFAENWQEAEAICRSFLKLRMRFHPYLYAAFYRYHQEGVPPFRALVLDYNEDKNVWRIDDQYMMGDRVMVAPVTAGVTGREVYLPEGQWYDFWNGLEYRGGQKLTLNVPLETIPLFVKGGSLLPLAEPTLHTEDPASMILDVTVYGDGELPCTLFEDDGMTLAYLKDAFNRLELRWDHSTAKGSVTRIGRADCPRYTVKDWRQVGRRT